ncbi:MAG TPA: DUF4870 domain-containing protein [Anaerolineales bacterium]|nr:DUF4870 domain-containing protein [Anaerolineales bacterium]
MSQEPMMEVTSDDKLWAALAYFLSPIVPVIILLMEDKKNRPYIKSHNAQALIMGILMAVVVPIIGTFTLGCGFVLYFLMWYWAYVAYQGKAINIPVVSDFVKNQGWA